MERRISKRVDDYMMGFKTSIVDLIKKQISDDENKELYDIMEYIYNYERFTLTKEDFMKRKRVKNVVPYFDRCCAKRANSEQCTRRKKQDFQYCGTHIKGTPHGIINSDETETQSIKVEVWVEDIKGIVYYIDKDNNVYDPEDIELNKINPKIIAKYVKKGDTYSIPELSL